MGAKAPGYSRPLSHGPVSKEAERKITAACPGAVVEPWAQGPNFHPYWGVHRQVLTGHATDLQARFRGASGGVITGLALYALQSGFADRVIQVTADPDHPTRNVIITSTTPQQVLEAAGSRYSSSSPLEDIDQLLAASGRMVFVGKPCDASALRRLGRLDPRVGEHVSLILSFFCAGISSHCAADRVISDMALQPEEVAAFRYRGHGWPGMATATTHSGRVETMTYARSWGDRLSHEVQFRCKICPDAVGGVADIACADAWHGDAQGYPDFEERDGRSLIVTRTEVGDTFLGDALRDLALVADPIDVSKIDDMQPGQARRKRLVQARTAALRLSGQPVPDMRGTGVALAARRAGLAEALRNLLGTLRRILTNLR